MVNHSVCNNVFECNSCFSLTANPVLVLTVDGSESLDVSLHSNLTFTCTETHGYPLPSFQWFRNNTQLNDSAGGSVTIRMVDSTQSQLVLSNVQAEDSGTYKCVATSSHGMNMYSANKGLTLRVLGESL